VFKKEVPLELLEEMCQIIGLKNIDDGCWFSRQSFTDLVIEQLQDFLLKLEPYYYPHKIFLIKREMTIVRYIQVLRHLAKSHGMILESKEHKDKYMNRKKRTYYRLNTRRLPTKTGIFVVSFD
jgi:hypothetical protein